MNIQLLNTKVDNLSLRKAETKEYTDKLEFSVGTAFSTDDLSRFLIIFDLSTVINEEYIFTVKYISSFKADKNINEDERESTFFSINAPAIAYPFLRSYVAHFMLNSGFDPIMLPTINFIKLVKNRKMSDEQSIVTN